MSILTRMTALETSSNLSQDVVLTPQSIRNVRIVARKYEFGLEDKEFG